MTQFRKKPVVVEAHEVSKLIADAETDPKSLPVWLHDAWEDGDTIFGSKHLTIHSESGTQVGYDGDFVIYNAVTKEISVSTRSVFLATFEPVT